MELIAIGCVWVDPSKVTAFYVQQNVKQRYDVIMMVGSDTLECRTDFRSEESAIMAMNDLVSLVNKYRD